MKIKWKKLLALGLAFSMAVGSFSVSGMTAMAEEASGEVTSQTSKTEYVVMAPGSTITLTNEDGYYESAVIGDESGIVTSATTAYGKKQVTSEEAFVSGAEYLISSSRSKEYLTSEVEQTNKNPATDGLKLVGYDANAPKPLWWKIEKENGKYRISRGESYLNIGNNTAKVDSDTTFDIELGLYNGNNSRDYGCWSIKGTHCLNQFGGEGYHCAAGYQTSSGDAGCWWQIWKVTTDITVTAGDTEGTTTVSVGDITYQIEVKNAQSLYLYGAKTAWTADDSDAYHGSVATNAIDGKTGKSQGYAEFGADNNKNSSYLQVDLETINLIQSIKMYRFYDNDDGTGRNYHKTVVAVAEKEEDFKNHRAYVVYNSDTSNTHGFGAGDDASYAETSRGHEFVLKVPTKARYIRIYMCGAIKNDGTDQCQTNHVCEVQANGYEIADQYALIKSLVEKTENLQAEYYTSTTWNKLQDAVNNAKVVIANDIMLVEDTEVTKHALDLEKAMSELVGNIHLDINESITLKNFQGNYASDTDLTDNGLNTSIATVSMSGVEQYESRMIRRANGLIAGKEYWIKNERAGKIMVPTHKTGSNNKSGLWLEGNISGRVMNADDSAFTNLWKIEYNSETSKYTVKGTDNLYVNMISNGRTDYLSSAPTNLEIRNNGGKAPWRFKQGALYMNHHSAANFGVDIASGWDGDGAENDGGSTWMLYICDDHSYTDVTFTGVRGGATLVEIGGITYNITVGEEFEGKDIVVDFGLPVTMTYDPVATKFTSGRALYGAVSINGTSNEAQWSVTYTPTQTMQGVDTVILQDENGTEYSFNVYPATNVYYDASFAEYTNYVDTIKEGTPTPTPSPTPWEQSWTGTTNVVQTATNTEEVDNYGYDSAYASAEAAAKEVATSTTIGDVATFEFTGRAVDVYMNCTSDTGKGLVRITVNNEDTNTVEKMLITDTKFLVKGSAVSRTTETPTAYGVPVVSISGLDHGNHKVTINHIKYSTETGSSRLIIDGFRVYNTLQNDVDGVYVADNEANPVYENLRNNLIASMSTNDYYLKYTTGSPFIFPNNTETSKTLEAEYAMLFNSGEGEKWPLEIKDAEWASNGKHLNSLNIGDKIKIPYFAEKAGTYSVTATYRSGSDKNYLAWSEETGKITSGTKSAGANDSASANHTVTFDLVVNEPGAGVWVFAPETADSPQLDKFVITLTSASTEKEPVKAPNKYAEQIAAGLLEDLLGKQGTATGVAIMSGEKYAELELQEFIENSSKNEIHLYPGQSLVFNLATAGKLQVGLRALNEAVTYKVNNGTETALESNVDMFYPIAVGANGGVTIANTGTTGVLAITKLKMSGNGTQTNAIEFRALTEKDFTNALVALGLVDGNLGVTEAPEEWGGEGTPTPTPTATPTVSATPEPTATVTPVVTETPEATVTPEATETPEVTETPEATEEPEVTETPEVTEAPEVTEVPEVTEAPEATETPEETKKVTTVFTDVYEDWYTEYVQYVYDNGLMTGIKGTTEFQPNANITKAQVAQVLYNMEGQPDIAEDAKVFTELTDVYAVEWYAKAVAWAYEAGVVTGDTNAKKFFPNADVTREQLALMMYRYASCKDYDVTSSSDLAGLQNAENVSNWAADGVKWAVGSGLISGIEKDGVKDLAPQGNASRAQVAAILQRFCENYK